LTVTRKSVIHAGRIVVFPSEKIDTRMLNNVPCRYIVYLFKATRIINVVVWTLNYRFGQIFLHSIVCDKKQFCRT